MVGRRVLAAMVGLAACVHADQQDGVETPAAEPRKPVDLQQQLEVVIEPGIHVELHARALSYGTSWSFEADVTIVNISDVTLTRHSPDLVAHWGIKLVTPTDNLGWGLSCSWATHWSKAFAAGESLEEQMVLFTDLDAGSSVELELRLCPLTTDTTPILANFEFPGPALARMRATVDPHGQLIAFELERHEERR